MGRRSVVIFVCLTYCYLRFLSLLYMRISYKHPTAILSICVSVSNRNLAGFKASIALQITYQWCVNLVSNNVSNIANLCQLDSRTISILSVVVKYGQHFV
jgi:hypothetical protein